MNAVKVALSGIVVSALLAGAVLYYNQVYAFYDRVDAASFGEVELTSIHTGQPEGIMTEGFEAIDSDSSPIRFRACFSTPCRPSAAERSELVRLLRREKRRRSSRNWRSCGLYGS